MSASEPTPSNPPPSGSAQPAEPGTGAAAEADEYPAEGATSEQVLHAQDESRAEGEPEPGE